MVTVIVLSSLPHAQCHKVKELQMRYRRKSSVEKINI
jgi:hypothetical protein